MNAGDDELSSTTTSIFPLNASTATVLRGLNGGGSNSNNNAVAAANRHSSLNSSSNLPSLKTSMETVPEWLQKNRTNFAKTKSKKKPDRFETASTLGF